MADGRKQTSWLDGASAAITRSIEVAVGSETIASNGGDEN